MNVNVNPICRNVNIKVFAECEWYIKRKPSLCNRDNDIGNKNHSLRCMKQN